METKKAIIFGAGITGLVTAWSLSQNGYEVTLIEKDNHVGGLSGTIDWDGWKFDFGAHSFHTRNTEILAFYKKLLPDKFFGLDITTKVFIFNKLITYPLVGAHIFLVLNSKTMILAGLDFFLSRLRSLFCGFKKTERLDEWIIDRFGRVLYGVYFSHYIERIQKKSPCELSKYLGEKKIPIFRIWQYLQRELFGIRNLHSDDVTLLDYYYCKGGFGEIASFFYEAILASKGVVKFNENVKHLAVQDGIVTRIETDRNFYDCKDCSVISTIPLSDLLGSIQNCGDRVRGAVGDLDHVRMRFLLMKVNRPQVMGYRWVNFSDPKFLFYRVSEYSYDKFRIVPENRCSLIFEIPLNKEDPLWAMDDQMLMDIILPMFNEAFVLSRGDIMSVKSLRTGHAVPVMSLAYRASLQCVFEYLHGVENLFSIGRQGLFTYINLDGCTKMGLDFADSLLEGKAKQKNMELLKLLHNI